MFDCDLCVGALKGTLSAEPFVRNDAKRILIASRAWMGLDLLWCHICNGASDVLRILVLRALRDQGNAKIAQQYFLIATQQHIFWLHIAVNQPLVMCIL